MRPDADFALAQSITAALKGKFWQVTPGEWWVVVEGVSSRKLVIWTNDPFGISFAPRKMNLAVARLRWRVIQQLQEAGIIFDDGSWTLAATSTFYPSSYDPAGHPTAVNPPSKNRRAVASANGNAVSWPTCRSKNG